MKRIVLPAIAFLVLNYIGVSMVMADKDRITNSSIEPNTVTYRIDAPTVTQRITAYPTIRFLPGDQVTINAGGCVQTGGWGSTWKRYVDPQGSNSERLYHGLIWIPGVTPGLVQIAGWIGRPLIVPTNYNSTQLYLRLGYEDDYYGDNGYYSHDNGTGNQCLGVGNAFVTITVVHPPTQIPQPPLPFDLVWNNVFDDNGIAKNPKWGLQATSPGSLPDATTLCSQFPLSNSVLSFGSPPCTVQHPSIDIPSGLNELICDIGGTSGKTNGHVNWGAATYTGPIYWDSRSTIGDDDYSLNLLTPNHAGSTAKNGVWDIHFEFSSGETINHFNTPWWVGFRNAANTSDSAAHTFIDGKQAIVMGLIDLDCEHSCTSELHPTWALAVHVKDDPSDDTWAIFLRNWGNEGFCSQDQHFLDLQTIKLRLPRALASGVTVTSQTQFVTNSYQTSGPFVALVPGQGAIVSFNLPRPEADARISGEIHLKWSLSSVQQPVEPADSLLAEAPQNLQSEEGDDDKPEKILADLVEQMTPEQRAIYDARMHELREPISYDSIVLPKESTAEVESYKSPTAESMRDFKKAKRDLIQFKALCEAFGGNIPGFPTACSQIPGQDPGKGRGPGHSN